MKQNNSNRSVDLNHLKSNPSLIKNRLPNQVFTGFSKLLANE